MAKVCPRNIKKIKGSRFFEILLKYSVRRYHRLGFGFCTDGTDSILFKDKTYYVNIMIVVCIV